MLIILSPVEVDNSYYLLVWLLTTVPEKHNAFIVDQSLEEFLKIRSFKVLL